MDGKYMHIPARAHNFSFCFYQQVSLGCVLLPTTRIFVLFENEQYTE